MPRTINPQIIERIKAINWLSQAGQPLQTDFPYQIRQVQNLKSASRYWGKRAWENAQLDASNAITCYMGDNYKTEYNKHWDVVVDAAKLHMKEVLQPSVEEVARLNELDGHFISNVQWDILGAIMEDSYADCNLPHTFRLDLLKLYEAGHMPCGWEGGTWPKGTLIVV